MPRQRFSGLEIIKALTSYDFRIVDRTGSHVKLRLDREDLDRPRIVSVPMANADDIPPGTMRSISRQSGAKDFQKWCAWIEDNC